MEGKINKSNIQQTVPNEEIMEERKYSEIIAENFQDVASQTQRSELKTKPHSPTGFILRLQGWINMRKSM